MASHLVLFLLATMSALVICAVDITGNGDVVVGQNGWDSARATFYGPPDASEGMGMYIYIHNNVSLYTMMIKLSNKLLVSYLSIMLNNC